MPRPQAAHPPARRRPRLAAAAVLIALLWGGGGAAQTHLFTETHTVRFPSGQAQPHRLDVGAAVWSGAAAAVFAGRSYAQIHVAASPADPLGMERGGRAITALRRAGGWRADHPNSVGFSRHEDVRPGAVRLALRLMPRRQPGCFWDLHITIPSMFGRKTLILPAPAQIFLPAEAEIVVRPADFAFAPGYRPMIFSPPRSITFPGGDRFQDARGGGNTLTAPILYPPPWRPAILDGSRSVNPTLGPGDLAALPPPQPCQTEVRLP